jgi:hypothetical protein
MILICLLIFRSVNFSYKHFITQLIISFIPFLYKSGWPIISYKLAKDNVTLFP